MTTNVQMWDPNIHVMQNNIRLIHPYIRVHNYCIPSHGKDRICYMEIFRPHFGLGISLNVGMTLSPLGFQNPNTFKYRIRTEAYHTCLHCAPNSYGIKVYDADNKNKIDGMMNMIIKYLTVENTSSEYIIGLIKESIKSVRVHFP